MFESVFDEINEKRSKKREFLNFLLKKDKLCLKLAYQGANFVMLKGNDEILEYNLKV